MFCKLALLLSVELFVLIAAVFLLVYISKQQVSKWFSYSAVAIVITIIVLMISSVCCAVCCKRCGPGKMKECRFENRRFGKQKMIRMHGGCPEEMMMNEGNWCEKEEACEMKKKCCERKGKVVKEIVIDTLPDKEVIIKKK